MTRPPLSIILTFYDEAAFIGLAVSSVAAQGIDGLELVIVNDNPARFGDDFFAGLALPAFARVVHHPENLGLSAARNTGLDHATGALVGFLDGDDYYTARGLAAQLARARATDADITHAQCFLSRLRSPQVDVLRRDRLLFATPQDAAGLTALEEAQFITSSWSSLYRRDFLDTFALRFDPEQRKFEDRLFVLQTVTAARRIATLGRPARVWRRRAGSISVTTPDADLHRLQVQLIEKCMAHMTRLTQAGTLPPRFLKREHFNTFGRVVWDMQIIDAIAQARDPAYAELGARIATLLDSDRFGHAIFDDVVLAPISRVGMRTRQGFISRTDAFALHKHLRENDFPAAAALLADRRAALSPPRPATPAAVRPRLMLHLGLHKTGTTYLQHQLVAQRDALLRQGVLVPLTGLLDHGHDPVRAGGQPGHQGLLAALRTGDDAIWSALRAEIVAHPAATVVISCENMILPLSEDRADLIAALAARLGMFRRITPLVCLRRPDHQIESFWREIVGNGQRMGARSLAEFAVDAGPVLTDLPALIGPFEALAGEDAVLLDYDAARTGDDLWPRFCTALGIATPPEAVAVPRYASLGPQAIQAARLVNTMIADPGLRLAVLRDLLTTWPAEDPGGWSLPVAAAQDLFDRFTQTSAAYAAARGYRPDVAAWTADLSTTPRAAEVALPATALTALRDARLRCERADGVPGDAPPPPAIVTAPAAPQIVIRPRPWLLRLLRRARLMR